MKPDRRTCLPEASLSDHGDQLKVVDAQRPLLNPMGQSVSRANIPECRNMSRRQHSHGKIAHESRSAQGRLVSETHFHGTMGCCAHKKTEGSNRTKMKKGKEETMCE